ncbi:MAG: hypothetical protein HY319_02680 [Armatimonadetes bacterium]|nr:hypothetical protein [Armatimonadota bacterium]
MTSSSAHQLFFSAQPRTSVAWAGTRHVEDTKDELRLPVDASETVTISGVPVRDFAIIEQMARVDAYLQAHGDAAPAEAPRSRAKEHEVAELGSRDALVERHEMAHYTTAGEHAASQPVYKYRLGPDGKSYRVGGHVMIDTAPVAGNPEATARKMEIVYRAALAPSSFDSLSGADLAVAALATSHLNKAQKEIWERQNAALSRQAMQSPVLVLF